MKIGFFSDPHAARVERTCGNRRPELSLGKIREALGFFVEEKVDFCVCLGDLVDLTPTHEEEIACLQEIMEVVKDSGLKFYFVPGNHDYTSFSGEELVDLIGQPLPPYCFEAGEIRFIALDGNFRADMRRFDVAGTVWTDAWLPPEQVEFLKEALDSSDKPCVILVHENLDSEVDGHHILHNADEVRKILADSGKVRMVVQGHFHEGASHVLDGIPYVTLPAMCEGEENAYRVIEL